MNFLDWTTIAVYLGGMILLSIYLGRGQEDEADYYVGGRNLPWWAVGISTMATQTSAISFISVPAFVALREGGGLTWLQYELAVPLAVIFVMIFLIPFFRRLKLISVYEYLELRFGPGTRTLLAGVFLLSRGLAAGVGIYASAIVLAVCLQTELWQMILLIGIVTLIYDTIGGMKAVVYSDVIQMVILVVGIILCVGYALSEVGGWDIAMSAHDPARFKALDFSTGWRDGGKFPMWGFLIGGFFLYASYYGCDQSQVQRELSAPTAEDTKLSLAFNGFARLPLTLAYVLLGLTVGAVFVMRPEAMALIPEGNPDYMVPTFVLEYLPHGIKALIFAAILAASMSSLDSSLNSLSASTMRDFIERYMPPKNLRHHLRLAKMTTVTWGILIIIFAFMLGGEETVVERINKVGSAFYGPILAAFATGVTISRVSGTGMVTGVLAGVVLNLVLWLGFADIFWMWWNLTGCVVAMLVALGVSLVKPQKEQNRGSGLLVLWDTDVWEEERRWLPVYGGLIVFFIGMVVLCAWLPGFLTPS
ncbi:MAG: sodium/solute symporter [Deltaproteobacteria bacterium]|nr:sodium/solute symporter [Deltaproteobacteria bacterium]